MLIFLTAELFVAVNTLPLLSTIFRPPMKTGRLSIVVSCRGLRLRPLRAEAVHPGVSQGWAAIKSIMMPANQKILIINRVN